MPHPAEEVLLHPSIGVSVRPHRAAYFAGEKLECTIQFTHHHQHSQHTTTTAPLTHTSSHPATPSINQLLAAYSLDPTTTTQTQPSRQHHSPLHPDHLSSNPLRKLSAPCPSSSSSPHLESFNPRRTSLQAVGSSAPPHHPSFPNNLNTSNSVSSSSCLLAWTYCQLDGYFQVQEKYINLDLFQPLRHPQTHGGGRLSFDQEGEGGDLIHDLDSPLVSPTRKKRPPASSRSSGWMGWLFGSNLSSRNRQNLHSPSPSLSSTSFLSSVPLNRFPVFQNPVSLLDIDLRLQPGQSRSYSFSIDLPINLPPTHKSKWIKFHYELIIGTNLIFEPTHPNNINNNNNNNNPTSFIKRHQNRSSSAQALSLSAGPFNTKFPNPSTSTSSLPLQKSRTFRVPIRVFNHVYVNETQNPTYDVFKPIISTKDTARVRRTSTTETTFFTSDNQAEPSVTSSRMYTPANRSNESPGAEDGKDNNAGLEDLEKYGLELLKSVHDDENLVKKDLPQGRHQGGDDMDVGCLAAIEMATRSSPKVSFDIMKDGTLVAQLTLFKSTYRLGETIEGSIEINGHHEEIKEGRTGGRVIKFGISLESIETLVDPQTPPPTNNNHPDHHKTPLTSSRTIPIITNSLNGAINNTTRKVYSEQEELVVDVGRAKFSLAIPPNASPEFQTNLVKFKWNLKLRLQFLPSLSNNKKEEHNPINNSSLSFSAQEQRRNISNPIHHIDQQKQHQQQGGGGIGEEELSNTGGFPTTRRPGSMDVGSVSNKPLNPSNFDTKKLTHSRSKSNGFFNQPNPNHNLSNNEEPRYSHLVAHSMAQGIYKPVPDLRMMAINSSSPSYQDNPSYKNNNDTTTTFASDSLHLNKVLNRFTFSPTFNLPSPTFNNNVFDQKFNGLDHPLVFLQPVFLDCFLPLKILPSITSPIPTHHSFFIS